MRRPPTRKWRESEHHERANRDAAPRCACGRVATFALTGYGPRWECAPCNAHVGCHPGTTTPLGTLADGPTRNARMRAHAAFDPLWQAKAARTGNRATARAAAYEWLAHALGLTLDECHIGRMDVATCNEVVRVCMPYLRRLHAAPHFITGDATP